MRDARLAGLLPCGEATSLFRALGIGEERLTNYLKRTETKKDRIRPQWWAPAELVRFNKAMERLGLSSKIRSEVLRCKQEGRDFPEKAQDALAIYTEGLLGRRW